MKHNPTGKKTKFKENIQDNNQNAKEPRLPYYQQRKRNTIIL
jgi:hypothetical protein